MISAPEPVEAVAARHQGLLEAPRFEADGSILFSDVIGGGVHRLTAAGDVEEVLPKRRGIGGLVQHEDGGVVASGRTVIHARAGESRELLALEGVTGFNDMHADAEGRVLAGALRFNPMQGEEPVPAEVHRIDAAGASVVVGEGVRWANGIGLSPGGERLYVCDYADARVLTFDLAAGDTAAEVFAEPPAGSTDGLAVDEEGGVWVALGQGGIARFHADGGLDGVTELPGRFVSSLSFGGPDRREVAITTLGGLYRARSEVAGLPAPRARV